MPENIDARHVASREHLYQTICDTMDFYPEITAKKELQRSDKIGNVAFVRQTHRHHGIKDPDVIGSIGEYQAHILNYLVHRGSLEIER